MEGFADRAQKPNALASAAIAVAVPAWPSNRDGAIYAWQSARVDNYVLPPEKTEPQVSRLLGNFDRNGWLQLRGGLESGWFK